MSEQNLPNHTTLQSAHAQALAQAGLREWHRIAANLDWDRLPDLLAETVVFRNPATFEPYHGKAPMVAILRVVFSVLKDFTYLRHFASANGTGFVLEFSARVGEEQLFGVDLVEFDHDGKITDFMVMMRPASAVITVSAEAGKLMAAAQASAT